MKEVREVASFRGESAVRTLDVVAIIRAMEHDMTALTAGHDVNTSFVDDPLSHLALLIPSLFHD
jgi:hypothetical protein